VCTNSDRLNNSSEFDYDDVGFGVCGKRVCFADAVFHDFSGSDGLRTPVRCSNIDKFADRELESLYS